MFGHLPALPVATIGGNYRHVYPPQTTTMTTFKYSNDHFTLTHSHTITHAITVIPPPPKERDREREVPFTCYDSSLRGLLDHLIIIFNLPLVSSRLVSSAEVRCLFLRLRCRVESSSGVCTVRVCFKDCGDARLSAIPSHLFHNQRHTFNRLWV